MTFIDVPDRLWMLAAAGFCALIAAGLGLTGGPYRPAAIAFAIFGVAHIVCSFDLDLPPIVLSPGLVVVLVGLAITGVKVLNEGMVQGGSRYVPLIVSATCITMPMGHMLFGDTGHQASIILLGIAFAALALPLAQVRQSRPLDAIHAGRA
ncbi:hypothetical protein FHP29_09575 [Nocardioides albidus]|uniref:Uncharacterized protein n=1 Tax=Nocardioides albidus TaxID=1517589 RepID=A0A5C4VZ26_9ACTN|nr:hypothetical protein [Nocardioides albidus]TNM41234.1 hypothetical protein FHP29_09575 [Nocardioides albidus]